MSDIISCIKRDLSGYFEIEKQLGSGAFGTTYKARLKEGVRLPEGIPLLPPVFVLKEQPIISEYPMNHNVDTYDSYAKRINKLNIEVAILSRLEHPNCVKFYFCYHYANKFVIVMELVEDNLSLMDIQRLTPEEKVIYIHGVLKGIEYLHSRGGLPS